MKFRGLMVFFAGLWLTWCWTTKPVDIDLATHTQIQTQLIEVIRFAVEQHRPSVQTIRFDRLWTEPLRADALKVHFKYSFLTDQVTATETVSGQARLKRLDENRWSLEKITTDQHLLAIQKGLLIQVTR